jgi:uncharacterized membrane protein
MRRATIFVLGLLCLLTAAPVRGAEMPAGIRGLWLMTEYPAITVRAGETATLKLKLQNANLPPEQVTLSATGVPDGWKAAFHGGGQPIGAAMAGPNEAVNVELRLEVPTDAKSGTQTLVLRAAGSTQRAELPVRVTLGNELPAKLSLKTKLPSLRGSPKSSFEYAVTVGNDSGKNLVVSLAADAPRNFQTSFTENYGSQEIASIPIDAGQTKELKVKVQPPGDVSAGSYDVRVRVLAEGAAAETSLTLDVNGQAKLRLAGKDGRLSGQAEAGNQADFALALTNDGSAAAEEVQLTATPPTDWKIEFEPKTIARLEPAQSITVQALVTPAAKAIAGDYMTTLRANAKGDSNSADFRVTVTTSTLWGIVGIGVIAIALLVVLGAVARFGRR